MAYKDLAKLYHADSSSDRYANLEEEHQHRLQADSTFRLGFRTTAGELFIACPRELTLLTQQVLAGESQIATLAASLPDEVYQPFLQGFVLDEVVSTNAIEDIASTREQVADALHAPSDSSAERTRFRDLALLYDALSHQRNPFGHVSGSEMRIAGSGALGDGSCASDRDSFNHEASLPRTLEDIRRIYDQVVKGEVPDSERPDGSLFRTDEVSIVQEAGNIVHRGLQSEASIREALQQLLRILHDPEIPALYRGIAGHFIFEYIHPFYDGNGRTGRYLLSLSLRGVLTTPTVLSLSQVIAKNRPRYFRAFKQAESLVNKGELTGFVLEMLRLIAAAQSQLVPKLQECLVTYGELQARCRDIATSEHLSSREEEVVTLLAIINRFGSLRTTPLSEIALRLGLKEQAARKHLAHLEERGVVRKTRLRRPLTFAFTEEFLEEHAL